LNLTDSPSDRKRLDAKCRELINKAERLKTSTNGKSETTVEEPLLEPPVSTRTLTTREKIILLEGSKLNNFVFKPWDQDPTSKDFELGPDQEPFTDSPALPLSDVQLECFDGWKRPSEALSAVRFPCTGDDHEVTMSTKGLDKIDLVQDLTSDCSVVASLCAGSSRVGRGHKKVSDLLIYCIV
jgi:calpain-7